MKKATILFFQITALILQSTFSYANEPDIKSNYSIGAILPLSGPLSAIGLGSRKGIDLAVKDINTKGGINNLPLKVYYEDSGADPAKALSAFYKLTNDINTPIIISGLTSVSQALKKPADDKGIILFAESSLKGMLNDSKLMMRNFTDSEIFYSDVREYLKSAKIRKIAVLRAAEEWAKGAFDVLTSGNDFEILVDEMIVKDATDVKSELVRFKSKSKEADIIVLLLLGSIQSIAINQIHQAHIKLPIATIYLCAQPEISKAVHNNFNGNLTFEGMRNADSQIYKDFLTKYKNDYHELEPEFNALSEYDTTLFIADALKHNLKNAEEIKNYFIEKKTFTGVLGVTEFDSNGDALHKGIPMVFNDGTCRPKN